MDPTGHLRLAQASKDIFWIVPSSHPSGQVWSVCLRIFVPLSRAKQVVEQQGHHEAKGGGLVPRVTFATFKQKPCDLTRKILNFCRKKPQVSVNSSQSWHYVASD